MMKAKYRNKKEITKEPEIGNNVSLRNDEIYGYRRN